MSTWSEARTAIKDFEYPVVGGGTGTQNSGSSPAETEITEEKLARRESYARQLGRRRERRRRERTTSLQSVKSAQFSRRLSIRFMRSRNAISAPWKRR